MPRVSHPRSGVVLTPPEAPDLAPAPAESSTPPRRASALRARLTELASFGMVGGIAFVVDIGVYNLLRLSVLDDKPIGAKVISVIVATIVAWIGNRTLTFRGRGDGPVLREAALFALANVIGLGVAALCLFVSHYALGFTSTLADNIAGNGVGLVLGMIVRYLAYRHLVFRPRPEAQASTATISPEGNRA